MRLKDAPVTDVRPLLVEERGDLLDLLRSLTDDDWRRPTSAGGWRVKDVALHLLDDDLGWLARGRDGDTSGLLDTTGDYRTFVASLDRKNQGWVDGASGLSPRLVCDLLEWSGREVDAFYATIDLASPARVIWASDDVAPMWLDLARDFTERWVHHQQIRNALRRPGHHTSKYLAVVLRTFVWAFPHQYRADAAVGTQVTIDLQEGDSWTLSRFDHCWELDEGAASSPAARVDMPGDVAWRILTGAPADRTNLRRSGPSHLVDALLDVRAIIV